MARDWTEEDVETLKSLYLNTKYEKIAEILGTTKSSVSHKVQRLKLPIKNRIFTNTEDDQQKKAWLIENAPTKTSKELASYLGLTNHQITGYLNQLGIKCLPSELLWTPEEDEWLKANYKDLTREEMAEKLGRAKHSITSRSRRLGLDCKSKRRLLHTLNEDYFKNYSREMFYIVGFLMADGCVWHGKRGHTKISIHLHPSDIKVIEFIKSQWEATHPIKEISTRNKKTGHVHLSSQFQVSSPTMAKDLEYFGVTNRKTGFEEVRNIPEEYISDFIRGYFDGDGWCAKNKNGQHYFGICCASAKFLEQIGRFLGLENIKEHGSIWAIQTNKLSKICEIGDFLYKNCVFSLSRKREVFKDAKDKHKAVISNKQKRDSLKSDVMFCFNSGMTKQSIMSLYSISRSQLDNIIKGTI